MAGNIKGITIEIGGNTTKLQKALKDVNGVSRDVNSELRNINKSLKFNPGNTELITQKQRALAKAVENTKEKLSTLKEAQKQASVALKNGKIGQDEYDALTREIIKTENQLKSFERQQKQVNSSFENFGNKIDAFGQKAEKMGNALKPISVASGAVLTGMTGLAVKSGQVADEINTLSKVTGVSVENLQKFKMAEELIDVSTETLGKSLARVTKSMYDARKGSVDQAAAFEYLGISVTNSNNELRDNQEVFYEIIDVLSTMTNETERNAVAQRIFGKSAQDLNPLIEGGAEQLRKLGEEAEKAGLIMSQEALNDINAFNDELDSTKAILTSVGMQLGASIGEVLLPMLQNMAEKVSEFAKKLKDVNPKVLKFSMVLLGILTASAPVLIIIGKMATGLKVLTGVFKMAPKLMNPYVLAITAIIAVGVLLYTHWDEVKAYATKTWNAIKTFFSNVWNGLKEKWSTFWNGIKTFFSTTWNAIKTTAETVFNAIKTKISEIWNGLKSVTSTVWNGIKSTLSTVWNGIKSVAQSTFDAIKNVISQIWNGLKSVTSSIWNGIKSTLSSVWNGIKSAAQSTWNAVKEAIVRPIEQAKEQIRRIVESIKSFFSNLKIELPEIKMPKMPKMPKWTGGTVTHTSRFSTKPISSKGSGWFDKGGIFDRPTIIGVGEKRPEFVGALDDLKKIVADVIVENNNGQGININVEKMEVRQDSDIERIAQELYNLQQRNSRRVGVIL